MVRFAELGATVYYLVLTDGSSGSEDRNADPVTLMRKRRQEQKQAGKLIGVADVFFRNYRDGTLASTIDVKRDVVRVIRKIRPDVVVSVDPSELYSSRFGFINHPDHRAAGQAALDAVFPLARDHLSFPELFYDEGLEPHKTETILLTNIERPNFAINISDTLEQKFDAIAAHASQVPDMTAVRKIFTSRAAELGEAFGYDFAETYVRIDVFST